MEVEKGKVASQCFGSMKGRLDMLMKLIVRGHHALNVHLFDCGAYLRCYRELVDDALRRPGYVLHLGSGDAATLNRAQELSHPESTFICLDLDLQALRANPARLKVVADAAALPFKSGTIGAICSEHLLEHLSDPQGVFRESQRVLREGGRFIFAAPNGWSYIALVARIVPLRFRETLVQFATHGTNRHQHQHFPTYYRANSVVAVQRLALRSGLSVERLEGFVGEPRYTLALPVLHVLAIAWHKLLELCSLQRVLGITLVGSLERRE